MLNILRSVKARDICQQWTVSKLVYLKDCQKHVIWDLRNINEHEGILILLQIDKLFLC